MFPQKAPLISGVDSKTYSLGEHSEHFQGRPNMALVALSHTPVEHQLYRAMLLALDENAKPALLTARRLMSVTGIRSLSTIRRGLEGLLSKLSIEREQKTTANGAAYRVYPPEEVIARRREQGLAGVERGELNHSFERAITRVVEHRSLSRREAQVALCCVEGLTNAQIGSRLQVTEQTVKFHLRHIFIKFGVRRRAELISRLLM
ncbi:MAG: LuxR C-terminal-related transcriptional regulator [Pyrinomonadaceae bacterium]|nr:LuxR C-terminal-related transcriptional regulator [Pyrinomonadaceae bacterium]